MSKEKLLVDIIARCEVCKEVTEHHLVHRSSFYGEPFHNIYECKKCGNHVEYKGRGEE